MLAENERDIEFLKGKIALEKSAASRPSFLAANELRALEPCIGDVASPRMVPGEGKINPLKRHLRRGGQGQGAGGALPARAATSWPSNATARTGRF